MTLDLATYCARGKVAGTKRALKGLGVAVLATTNPWEVLRFKCKFGVGVVHQNAKGELKGSPSAISALQHIDAGRTDPIPPKVKNRRLRPERAVGLKADVVIFADASLCPQTGAAGWGGWMVGADMPSSTAGGSLKDLLATSGHAEAAALANVLHVARQRGYLRAGAVVMLQSDSTLALGAIAKYFGGRDSPPRDSADGVAVAMPRRPLHPAVARAVKAVGLIVDELGLQIVVRHVRGHRDGGVETGQGRNWVNRTCDALAKAGMEARRAEIRAAKQQSTEQPQEAVTFP